MKFSATSGIAIAPILFVIALLAILATAIAAGSSTFSGGTDQEKARVMASEIVSICDQYKTAVERISALGCDITKVDYTPNSSFPFGAGSTNPDFTN